MQTHIFHSKHECTLLSIVIEFFWSQGLVDISTIAMQTGSSWRQKSGGTTVIVQEAAR
jgi:hypothetical protein